MSVTYTATTPAATSTATMYPVATSVTLARVVDGRPMWTGVMPGSDADQRSWSAASSRRIPARAARTWRGP